MLLSYWPCRNSQKKKEKKLTWEKTRRQPRSSLLNGAWAAKHHLAIWWTKIHSRNTTQRYHIAPPLRVSTARRWFPLISKQNPSICSSRVGRGFVLLPLYLEHHHQSHNGEHISESALRIRTGHTTNKESEMFKLWVPRPLTPYETRIGPPFRSMWQWREATHTMAVTCHVLRQANKIAPIYYRQRLPYHFRQKNKITIQSVTVHACLSAMEGQLTDMTLSSNGKYRSLLPVKVRERAPAVSILYRLNTRTV